MIGQRRCLGFERTMEVPVRFVPVATLYDAYPNSSNSFSLFLNLSSTPEVKITKSVNKSGEEVIEKEYKKEGQVKHVVKKLCSGNAEGYLKWKEQLNHVLNNRPCKSPKAELDIAEAMLFGDLLESWKLWRQSEAEKDIEKTFATKETNTKYRKKVKQGETEEVLKICLGKIRQRLIKKLRYSKAKVLHTFESAEAKVLGC